MGGACSQHVGDCPKLVGKPVETTQLGRPTRTWNDNITMDLSAVELEMWIGFIWLKKQTICCLM